MNIELNKLSNIEKLNLISTIWDSIEDKDSFIPLDESHIKILSERLNVDGKTISWEESKTKIQNIFK